MKKGLPKLSGFNLFLFIFFLCFCFAQNGYADNSLKPNLPGCKINPGVFPSDNQPLKANFKSITPVLASKENGTVSNKNLYVSLYYKDYRDTLYLQDGFLMSYDNSYSILVDNEDVRKFLNASDNLGIMRFGQQLIVERRPDIIGEDTSFLKLAQTRLGTYKLVSSFQNMNIRGFQACIYDSYLNKATPLSLTDDTGFEFSITSDAASQATDRFIVTYKQAELTGVLPVNITSVEALRLPTGKIAVKWQVENEDQITKYEVERSADGITFNPILSTSSNSNSTGRESYSKDDNSPLSANNFYRVKAYSLSGQIQYSGIVKVSPLNMKGSFTISPNPVQGKTIQLHCVNQQKGNYTLILNNMAGQVMYRNPIRIDDGEISKSIQTDAAPGNYQVTLISASGNKQTQSIIIL